MECHLCEWGLTVERVVQKLCTVNTLTNKMQHGARIKSFSTLQLKKKKKKVLRNKQNTAVKKTQMQIALYFPHSQAENKRKIIYHRERDMKFQKCYVMSCSEILK